MVARLKSGAIGMKSEAAWLKLGSGAWGVGLITVGVESLADFVKSMVRLLIACTKSCWLNKDILEFSMAIRSHSRLFSMFF